MGLAVSTVLFIISTTVSVAMAVQAKKKAKAAREASLGQDVRVTNSAEPLSIHYGRTATSGVRTNVATGHNFNNNLFNGTNLQSSLGNVSDGKKNEYMVTEVAIGIGEIVNIEQVWTDDQGPFGSDITNFQTAYWNPPGISNASAAMAVLDPKHNAPYFDGQIKQTSVFTGLTHAVNIYKLNRDEPQYSGIPHPLYFIKEGTKIRTITPPGAAATSTAKAGHPTRYTITRNLADTEDLLVYNNTVAYVLLDYLTNKLYGVNWKLYTEAEKAANTSLVDDLDLEAFYKAYLVCAEIVQGTDNVLFYLETEDDDGPMPSGTEISVEYPPAYVDTSTYQAGQLVPRAYRDAAGDVYWTAMNLNASGETVFSYNLNGFIEALNQPTGITATESLFRYEYNGSISTGDNHRSNISAIIGVINGVEFFRSPTGQWKLVVPDSLTPTDKAKLFVSGTTYLKFDRVNYTPTTGDAAGITSIYEQVTTTTTTSPENNRTVWARIHTAMEPALYSSAVTYSSGDVVKHFVPVASSDAFANTTGLYVYIKGTASNDNPTITTSWRRVLYNPEKAQVVGVIDTSELSSDVAISYPDATDKYNQLDVRFPNVNRQYADDTITFPPEGSALHKDFLAQDNEKDLKDLYDMRGLVDPFHAKAWASNKLRQSRREVYEFETRPSGFLYEPGDILQIKDEAVNFGNKEIYVKIINTKVKTDLSVKFSAIRFFPSDYGWEIAALPTLTNRAPITISTLPPVFPALNSSGFPNSNFDLTNTATSREIPLTWTLSEDTDIGMYQVVIETQQQSTTPNESNWATLVTLPSSITEYTHVIGDSAATHWYRIYGVTTDQRKIGPGTALLDYGRATVGVRPAVITTTMTTSNGTVFRDDTGTTVLTMNVFIDGILSTDHDDYSYSWQIVNSAGTDKVITVSSTLPGTGFPLLLNDTINGGPLLSIGDASTLASRASITAPVGSNGVPADTLSTQTIANTAVKGGLRHLTVGAEDVFSFQQFTCIVGNLPD